MGEPPGTQRSSIRSLPHGVRCLQVVSVVGMVWGLLSAGLQASDAHLLAAVLAGLQGACMAGLAWLSWWRPSLTVVDEAGLLVRSRTLALEQIPWDAVVRVVPEGPRERSSTVHLRDGSSTALPGVGRQDALWLSGVVADRHRQAQARDHAAEPARPGPVRWRRGVPRG